MGDKTKGKHFVLVHGASHGAWCWYKLIDLLKKAGHSVTALDMAAAGINMKAMEELLTFEDYCQPLLDFLASLPAEEKVILVGNSLGGLNLALAMEKFPRRISVAVFAAALVPDTNHPPSYIMDKFFESVREGGWPDPPGLEFTRAMYCQSPTEDFELFMTLRRPSLSATLREDLSKASKLSKEGYGSVRRVFIRSREDKGITETFARWMIENSGIQEVREVEDADHMIMLSQPQRLCDCLVEIAGT